MTPFPLYPKFFHRFTTKVADRGKTENVEEEYMAETEEPTKEKHTSATYQQGIDDFYQSQAESQKKKTGYHS